MHNQDKINTFLKGLEVLLLGFFLSTNISFAQEDGSDGGSGDQEYYEQVEQSGEDYDPYAAQDIEERRREERELEEASGLRKKSLEEILESELKKDQKFFKKAEKLHAAGKLNPQALLQQLKGQKGSKSGAKASWSQKAYDALAGFRSLSYKEALSHIKTELQDQPAGRFFEKHPESYDFITQVLQDEKAIPQAVKIFENKTKLIWFVALNIATVFFGMLLKRIGRDKKRGVIGVIVRLFTRIIILLSLRIGIFIHFFKNELGPIWEIFKKTIL